MIPDKFKHIAADGFPRLVAEPGGIVLDPPALEPAFGDGFLLPFADVGVIPGACVHIGVNEA